MKIARMKIESNQVEGRRTAVVERYTEIIDSEEKEKINK